MRAIGVSQVFLLSKVIDLIESESIDYNNAKVVDRIEKLMCL